MSKKLIAVASAAALAITALVGIAPAHATPTITYTDASGVDTVGTAASPFASLVPEANTLLSTGANTLKIVVSAVNPGDSATVSIAGTAKVVGDAVGTASKNFNVSTLGGASLTKTLSAAGDMTFYVYGTSTAAASTITTTVTKTLSGTKSTTTSTKYFKPSIGQAFFVTNIVAPSTIAAGADGEVTFKLTDVFGNAIGTSSSAAIAGALTSAGDVVTTDGQASYDATRSVWVSEFTAPANTRPFILTVTGGATPSNDDLGLGTHTLANNVITVNASGVASQVAALTAQLAESRPKATSVTKKKYNTLARKWNAAFPSQKVALKK